MYNRRIPIDIKDRLKVEGGMIRNHGQIKLNGSDEITNVQNTKPQVKVYRSRQSNLGPISQKGPEFTFYDLIVSTSQEDEELRYNCFEDWVFPKMIYPDQGNGQVPIMIPVRTIRRGVNRIPMEDDTKQITQMTSSECIQYAYILLNPNMVPVRSFGLHPGMTVNRTQHLACIQVGDPRTGRVDNAFVQYVVQLNTPVQKCCAVETTEMVDGECLYYYRIEGDKALEQKIFNDWFCTNQYFFNGVVFPKIRGYMADE